MTFGIARPEPWLAAVFEGAGTTCWWHAATGDAGGEVWDEARAAAWIRMPEVTFFARAAAFAAWREAWWPASQIAEIAPLDPRLLAAERAVALAALDGVTDDPDAAKRALQEFAAWSAELGYLESLDAPVFRERGINVHADLARLADDYGVELAFVNAAERVRDYALAASGSAPTAALVSGSDPVDPGSVPQGTIDPFARIEWRLSATMALEVTAAVAPVIGSAPNIDLAAWIGPVEVPLARAEGVWTGHASNAAALLTLPPAERAARLVARGFDPIPGVDAETLARIAEQS